MIEPIDISPQLRNLCRNVHLLRQKQGLSIETLAKKAHVKVSCLRSLENQIVPDDFEIEEFFRLCGCLGIEPTDILKEELKD